MEAFQIRAMINDAVEVAIERFSTEIGALSATVSKAQAYKMYTRTNVDRWISLGLLKGIKKGNKNSKVEFDRVELRLLAKTDNRAIYQ